MSHIPFFHTNYGLGGSDLKTLFECLLKYRITTCGIVDDNFFGLPEFLKFAKAYGVKPVIGARVPVSSPLTLPSPAKGEDKDVAAPFRVRQYLYLFMKDRGGYENLCAILTARAFGKLDLQTVKDHAAGLVLLSDSIPALKELKICFKDIFYLLTPGHDVYCADFPAAAANEVFYVTPEEKTIYRLMCAIKKHQHETNPRVFGHLMTIREFSACFAGYPRAVQNNRELAGICGFVPENSNWVFPGSSEKLLDIIGPRCRNLTRLQKERADYEYRIIKAMGFEPYFILVHRLKEYALGKNIGMNVRGSAASSYILYLLGLSVVDPLKFDLPFERFLNPQRTEPPDIDVDVEFNQRDRLIREIYGRFGIDRVAHIAVINRFQRRARFRDTARAYGVSPLELKTIRDHTGEYLIKRINNVADRIDGFPHYFSCHPSGIVIAPQPVTSYAPLYPSPAGNIVHYDKDGIEITGLVKIDILGVRGFPALYLKREKISLEDKRVYEFISSGKSLGCFQIESPAVRHMIGNIKPRTIMDIANAIAIIRPGPAQGGMKERFWKRLHGEEAIECLHPSLADTLKDTLGIPVYQEQILQIAQKFADFSLSEGDLLRRTMTKERNPLRMKEVEELFFSRARGLGYDNKDIEKVWQRVAAFSSFGFNKAHSTTYATLAYLSAYQKLYYPHDFFRLVINNKGGYYPSHAYINDARRWGIKILGPDINRSDIGFSVVQNRCGSHAEEIASPLREVGARNDRVTGHCEERERRSNLSFHHCDLGDSALLTGLTEIKDLSLTTMKRILKHRPFRSAEDLFRHARPAIDEGTALIKSGALNCLGESWPRMYYILLRDSSFRSAKLRMTKEDRHCGDQVPLSLRGVPKERRSNLILLSDKIPDLPDFDDKIKLQEQFKTLGFFPAYHPLEFLYPQRKARIADAVEGRPIELTGLLITRRVVMTKTKQLMSFLTLDDETGILEAVVFPRVYAPGLSGPIMKIGGVIKDQNLIAYRCANMPGLLAA
ncbi:MAG TPA: PHP domain-containing protein [bacterium]